MTREEKQFLRRLRDVVEEYIGNQKDLADRLGLARCSASRILSNPLLAYKSVARIGLLDERIDLNTLVRGKPLACSGTYSDADMGRLYEEVRALREEMRVMKEYVSMLTDEVADAVRPNRNI